MQKMRNLRVYYIGVLCLTLVATLTRTLSLTLSLDKASGYFKANAVLPVALVVVLALAGVAILLYPILLRDRVPQSNAGGSNLTTATSILCALLFLVSFVATCMAKGVVALPTFLWLVGILSLLAATIYFLTKTSLCSIGTSGSAVFGSLTLIALGCLITVTYFDVATPMNAPIKIHLHLALLAMMLCLLYELRDTVGAPMPRARTAFTALAFFLSVTVGVSDIITALAGYTKGFIYLSSDFLLVGLGLYVATKGAADLQALSQTERKTVNK